MRAAARVARDAGLALPVELFPRIPQPCPLCSCQLHGRQVGERSIRCDDACVVARAPRIAGLTPKNERGPDDDLRLQFEATQRLTDEEKTTVKRVLEGLLLAHEAKRWAA